MPFATQAASQHGQPVNPKDAFYAMVPGPAAVEPPYPPLQPWQDLATNYLTDDFDTPKDEPDPEENLCVPAGYTYFGQMVDHDLTFDTTSSLDTPQRAEFSNKRTPRFDLDCVYGAGPDDAPYLYEDGVRLVAGNNDLPRAANGRAIIGDPRNDENSIVCQLQMAFLRYHNAVVDRIAMATPGIKPKELFKTARNEVRWTYQRILVEDYLPRIIANTDLTAFDHLRGAADSVAKSTKAGGFSLYPAGSRSKIPLEFAAAAYRFGHSMVRNGYRLNANTKKHIFAPSGPDSLVGFGELPISHLIDWSLFFPDPDRRDPAKTPVLAHIQLRSESVKAGSFDATNTAFGRERLQFAYKIDPILVDPLAHLPFSIAGVVGPLQSLGLRNLVRGRGFDLPSGQEVATKAGLPALTKAELVVRSKDKVSNTQHMKAIPNEFTTNTPLWLYVLIEAQSNLASWAAGKVSFSEDDLVDDAAKTTTQLRGVGARIILETFQGLLDSDEESYRNSPEAINWKPLIKHDNGKPIFNMWNLVTCNLE